MFKFKKPEKPKFDDEINRLVIDKRRLDISNKRTIGSGRFGLHRLPARLRWSEMCLKESRTTGTDHMDAFVKEAKFLSQVKLMFCFFVFKFISCSVAYTLNENLTFMFT